MTFATSNRTALERVKETVWSQTPASPALTAFRYTGESLDDNITTETSKEIRSDRAVTDLIVTDASISGDVNFELSYGAFDDLFAAAFMTTASSPSTISEISADISSTSTGFSSTLAGKFSSISAGMMVKIAGFPTAANNGYYYVTAATGTSLTTSPVPATIETPTGSAASVKTSASLRNGITEQSFTIVETFNDATVLTRRHFFGMRVKGFTLDMKTGSILTGKFSFIGQSATYSTTGFSGETHVAATTNAVMNCVGNIQAIEFDGAALGSPGAVMSASVEFDNQHRMQKGIGVLGNVGVVAGQLMIKVTAQQYFESKAQADKFKAATAFRWSVMFQDAGGNGYVLTLPKCKYDQFKVNSSQLDSDVTAQTSFRALLDPITNCMAQWDAFVGP